MAAPGYALNQATQSEQAPTVQSRLRNVEQLVESCQMSANYILGGGPEPAADKIAPDGVNATLQRIEREVEVLLQKLNDIRNQVGTL